MQLGLNMSVDNDVLDNPQIVPNRFNSPSNAVAPMQTASIEVPQAKSFRPPISPLKQPS